MKVQIVSFHCVLKNKLGKVISSTFNQDILTGGDQEQQQLMGLSKRLHDLKQGEKRRIDLSAAEAYGFYDPKMVITVPRQNISEVKFHDEGQQTIMMTMDGRPRSFRVVDSNAESVTLDGNHPLAGQDLVFEIETVTVRDATPEEISDSHGSGSGPTFH